MAEVTPNSINQPTTLLTANATSGATSLSVSAPTAPDAWPTTGQFRVLVGTELIVVTAASGAATTLTVVARGAEGTTAAAHTTGDQVNIVLTDGAFTATAVRSIAKTGAAKLFGDVTLTPGTNVTLTQVGNDIGIAASGGGGGGGGGGQLDYVTRTTDLTVNGSSGAPNTVVTGNAVSYDGVTRVRIEFGTAYAIAGTAALIIELFEDATSIGRIVQTNANGEFAGLADPVYRTPSAGSHTYTVKAWKSGGTDGTIIGQSAFAPIFLRVSTDGGGSGGLTSLASGTAVDVVNTATETDLCSFTIPANALGANGYVRLHLTGDFLFNAALLLTVRVKVGSTTLWAVGTAQSASGTRYAHAIDVLFGNKNSATANALDVEWFMAAAEVADGGSGALGRFGGNIARGINGSCGIDTTSAWTFKVTGQWSGASASTSIRKHHALVEYVAVA